MSSGGVEFDGVGGEVVEVFDDAFGGGEERFGGGAGVVDGIGVEVTAKNVFAIVGGLIGIVGEVIEGVSEGEPDIGGFVFGGVDGVVEQKDGEADVNPTVVGVIIADFGEFSVHGVEFGEFVHRAFHWLCSPV